MTQTINIKLEEITTLYAAGYRRIELERSTTPDSGFANITNIDLVDETVYYSYEDSNGLVTSYYRYRLTGTAGAAPLSNYSNAFKAPGLTRLLVRQAAMRSYGGGQTMAIVAGGSTTVAKFADYDIDLSLYSSGRGVGSWLHPTEGNNVGQTRIVSSSDPSTGAFTVDPAWSLTPTTGAIFEWHKLAPPSDWNDAINRALERYPFVDRIPIVGTGDEINLTELVPTIPNKSWVYGLWYRPTGFYFDQPWGSNGRWWSVREDMTGIFLQTYPVLDTDETAYLDVRRVLDPIYTDDAVLPPRTNVRLLAAIVYDEILDLLSNDNSRASATDRVGYARRRRVHQKRLQSLWRIYSPRIQAQSPQPSQPTGVSPTWRAR